MHILLTLSQPCNILRWPMVPERFNCFALRYSSAQVGDERLKHHSSDDVTASKFVRVGENSTQILPQSVQLGVELGLQFGQGKALVLCEEQAQRGSR